MKQLIRMGKLIVILLAVLALCCSSCCADDDNLSLSGEDRSTWVCYICHGLSDWNYCPWCGSGRPSTLVQCPKCLMMFDGRENFVFCLSCGALLHPEDMEGLSDAEVMEKRLGLFMLYWRPYRLLDMLDYCAPSWMEQQESPNLSLFLLLQNRTVDSYELASSQMSEDGLSCNVEMDCMVNKHNNKDFVPYSVSLTMVSEDGQWYADPASLQMEKQEQSADGQ